MNLSTATVQSLALDYVTGKTPTQLLALYQDRLWRFNAHASVKTQNIVMRCEFPRLLELRDGNDAVGPVFIVQHGRRALTGAPILWRVTCRRLARGNRPWRIDVDELTHGDPRALLEAIAKHANPASA